MEASAEPEDHRAIPMAGVRMRIISFGYIHGDPPAAHLTLDVRKLFRDPHIDLAMRNLTGLDHHVCDNVLRQPEALAFVRSLATMARVLKKISPEATIAIGCAGGRHRSVAIAHALSFMVAATLIHRDINKPVILRSSQGERR